MVAGGSSLHHIKDETVCVFRKVHYVGVLFNPVAYFKYSLFNTVTESFSLYEVSAA